MLGGASSENLSMVSGTKKKISICTVTYNSAKDVKRFLRSCEDCLKNYDLEVVAVDNSSSDGTVSLIEKESLSLNKRVIRNERNVFYTKAMNEAMSLAEGEYILVVNPDCYFDVSLIDQLITQMERNDEIGICGPSFYYPDGRRQPSGNRFPSRRAFLELALGRNRRFFADPGDGPPPQQNVRYHDFIHGACFLIRRDFYNTIGKFDENFVHGWDEYDYGKRVTASGKRCASVMSAKCFHSVGGSGSEGVAPALREHYVNGLLYLTRKYYGSLFEKLMISCMRSARAKQKVGTLPRKITWAVYSARHSTMKFLRKRLL